MNKNTITKASIFDFDGTLIDTPLPTDENKWKWVKHHGVQKWPFQGWWGRNESLDINVWEMEPIDSTILQYEIEKTLSHALKVMLTGRTHKQAESVKKILSKHKLTFDRYLFKRSGDTLTDKIQQLDSLLSEFPNIIEIEMWDDRTEHIPEFEKWGETKISENRISKFKINHVISTHH